MAEPTISVATQNACKLCSPLGATFALKGIADSISIIHGSQGCSTYIRRYMISHFKEPIDIASSNFSEDTAIFGGNKNLQIALDNIRVQYNPRLIGIATSCLSETIGEDVPMILREYREARAGEDLPYLIHVSTPSYRETHSEGFHTVARALVENISEDTDKGNHVTLLPGMVSPADLRYFKEIVSDFGVDYNLIPDYSETLDGGLWDQYHRIPEGGTPIESIRRAGGSLATIEMGATLRREKSAGGFLNDKFGVPLYSIGMPIGIRETDKLFAALEENTGTPTPKKHSDERNRLIDAYVDGHKYVFGQRAAVYGEQDFVVAMVGFLSEVGIIPAVAASGGKSGVFEEKIREIYPDTDKHSISIIEDVDFMDIEAEAREQNADLVIGNSKGFKLSKALDIPLIRAGFPIHDRFGGSRILHVGYRGAQQLFDRIVNAVIEQRQAENPVGYTYM